MTATKCPWLPPCWHYVSLLVYAVQNTWRKHRRNWVSTLTATAIRQPFRHNKHACMKCVYPYIVTLQINCNAMFQSCHSRSYMLPRPSDSMSSCYCLLTVHTEPHLWSQYYNQKSLILNINSYCYDQASRINSYPKVMSKRIWASEKQAQSLKFSALHTLLY